MGYKYIISYSDLMQSIGFVFVQQITLQTHCDGRYYPDNT